MALALTPHSNAASYSSLIDDSTIRERGQSPGCVWVAGLWISRDRARFEALIDGGMEAGLLVCGKGAFAGHFTHAFSAHGDAMGVVDELIQDGVGEGRILSCW